MKKQSTHLFKGHLIRSAFYLVLLLAVCVIPFALGQRNSNKQTIAAKPNVANTNPTVAATRGDMPSFTGAAGVSDAHKAGLEVRKPSSGSIGVHRFPTPIYGAGGSPRPAQPICGVRNAYAHGYADTVSTPGAHRSY